MAICGNISLFVAHSDGEEEEQENNGVDEECNVSCLFSLLVRREREREKKKSSVIFSIKI